MKVTYEDLPAIITIDEAIEKNSFYPCSPEIKDGSIEEQKNQSDHHIQGTVFIGGQEHFYLETQCSVTFPLDNNSLEVYSSTQNLTETQVFCSLVCGIQASKIIVKCKRMGGGFGGKETRSVPFACISALAAYTLNRPVSIALERDTDMSITGQRHAFRVDYQAGCNNDGKFTYLEANVYNNGGYSLDASQAVNETALFHLDSCYKWDAVHVKGKVCQTNQPSHTAFRGFGAPQAMTVTETMLMQFANLLKVSPESLRARNFYQEGNRTHFGQKLEFWHIPPMWQQIHEIADVTNRMKEIEIFNSQNRWRKRGFALLPTKYGINFTAVFMNQVSFMLMASSSILLNLFFFIVLIRAEPWCIYIWMDLCW